MQVVRIQSGTRQLAAHLQGEGDSRGTQPAPCQQSQSQCQRTFAPSTPPDLSFVYTAVRWGAGGARAVDVAPHANGQHQLTDTCAWLLARWAKRLSRKEVAKWCKATIPSKIEPMKKIAPMMHTHHPLLFNWFRTKGQLYRGLVDDFNTQAKLTARKSFGFRTYHAMEIAL